MPLITTNLVVGDQQPNIPQKQVNPTPAKQAAKPVPVRRPSIVQEPPQVKAKEIKVSKHSQYIVDMLTNNEET